jgi:hypothetical protein
MTRPDLIKVCGGLASVGRQSRLFATFVIDRASGVDRLIE